MKTFKENRELVLGFIGEEWTRSTEIFSQAESKLVSRHLKRALEDELIVVRRVSRSEVYYKKPTDVELMLANVIKCARQLMAEPKIFDDEYVEKVRAKIESGQVGMAELGEEMKAFEEQKAVLHDCLENLYSAYCKMCNLERPKAPTTQQGEYVTIMRENMDEYLADGYEIHDVITNEVITMRRVGTEGTSGTSQNHVPPTRLK